jgi:ABC-2 type transport system ATP-binding protein
MSAAIQVEKLAKTFRKPFSGRTVEAVKGVTFKVKKGEVFGFVGPNGAGKTTCIKMLTGLIFATSGSAKVFGHPIPSPEAMQRVGFVPENPYIYPYLTPREFVDHCGRLSGLSGLEVEERVETVIDRVGMTEAIDRPVRALSKGMTQRVALAAALVHDPDLLILDEPMSGLDPVGRKDVRDLILEERARKKTVFFSTHILGDVETLCDRVCILRKGSVVVSGALSELLDRSAQTSEIAIEGASDALRDVLRSIGTLRDAGVQLLLDVPTEDAKKRALEAILAQGATVASISSKRETLEELFVRRAL